jgi:hypothetical protein
MVYSYGGDVDLGMGEGHRFRVSVRIPIYSDLASGPVDDRMDRGLGGGEGRGDPDLRCRLGRREGGGVGEVGGGGGRGLLGSFWRCGCAMGRIRIRVVVSD